MAARNESRERGPFSCHVRPNLAAHAKIRLVSIRPPSVRLKVVFGRATPHRSPTSRRCGVRPETGPRRGAKFYRTMFPSMNHGWKGTPTSWLSIWRRVEPSRHWRRGDRFESTNPGGLAWAFSPPPPGPPTARSSSPARSMRRETGIRCLDRSRQLARWYAPHGCTIEFRTLDVRPGGEFHSCIRTPDGHECWCRGVYRTINRPVQIVLTMGSRMRRASWWGPRLQAWTRTGR